MSKLTLTAMVAIMGLAGCTSQKPAEEPENGSAGVEPEDQDSEVTEEGSDEEADEESAAESDETVAQTQEEVEKTGDSPASSASSRSASSKPACAGREQKLCEVTVGCAWSTTKECIGQ